MSYRPLGDDSTPSINFSGGNIDQAQPVETQLVARSQRPSCYFNPQDQRGCSMELPFIKQDNWIVLSSGGPLQYQYQAELERMGSLSLTTFTPLLMSNGTSGQAVELTIYAWATDVELMGPSAAFQSGKADEFGTTPISDVATSVAAAAGSLTGVPSIAPYARATQMVSSGISAVAKALGYSKPPNIAPIAPYKYLTNPSIANATIPVPSDVLAIDPKAELTIDPRTVCAGDEDPNLISSIAQRESYWFTTTWAVSDPTNTQLARFAVTPEVFRAQARVGTGAAGDYFVKQMSPMCHLAQVFGYWQGDIIYTFRFVCSKYHRGRARIFYEPEGLGSPTLDSAYNINHIIDIGSTTTFEMRVPYMRSTPWAKVQHLAVANSTAVNYEVRTATPFDYVPETMNGVVTLQVLNDLSAPDTSADIYVVISARAADNFSLAQPRSLTSHYGDLNEHPVSYGDLAAFQSGLSDEPEQNHEMSVSIPAQVPTMDPYVFMGEKVTSLKQLFARACHYLHYAPENDVVSNSEMLVSLTQPRFPRQYGPDVSGVTDHSLSSGGNHGYNFVNHSFLTWFTPCFAGWRGSIIWRIQPCKQFLPVTGWPGLQPNNVASAAHIERFPFQTYYNLAGVSLSGVEVDRLICDNTSAGPKYSSFFQSRFDFMNGTAAAASDMEPVNMAAVPMYSAFRMHPANPGLLSLPRDSANGQLISYNTDYESDNVRFTVWGTGSANTSTIFSHPFALYVAGGDDFTPFMYLNSPTVYIGSSEGAPANSGSQRSAIFGEY
jgi:hypothetical protein